MASEQAIDAGAAALRMRAQGGKRLNPWPDLPASVKRKWRDYASVVLTAAEKAEMQPYKTPALPG